MSIAKKQKLPPLSSNTKILSFDIETNDLHGKAFAVGAVLVDSKGNIIDEFSGRTDIIGPVHEWVQEKVLPVIADMPINFSSYEELREAFWSWYLKAEAESDYVVVNNGYPIEYKFLLECQGADLEKRYWQHPFPILDLSSLLIMLGVDKNEFIRELMQKHGFKAHHPVHDATIAALAAFKAFRQSGQIQ